MTITRNPCKHKNLSVAVNSDLDFLLANITPDWCFKKILHRGKADRLAIAVLTELMRLRHDYGDDNGDFELTDCFFYFKQKFSLKKAQILRATARLSKSTIVVRSFRTFVHMNGDISKEIDLLLNSAAVNNLIAEWEEEYA